jgi:hypothetical protein
MFDIYLIYMYIISMTYNKTVSLAIAYYTALLDNEYLPIHLNYECYECNTILIVARDNTDLYYDMSTKSVYVPDNNNNGYYYEIGILMRCHNKCYSSVIHNNIHYIVAKRCIINEKKYIKCAITKFVFDISNDRMTLFDISNDRMTLFGYY